MTAVKIKAKLKELALWQPAFNTLKKEDLQAELRKHFPASREDESQNQKSVVKFENDIGTPVSLWAGHFHGNSELLVGATEGRIHYCTYGSDGSQKR